MAVVVEAMATGTAEASDLFESIVDELCNEEVGDGEEEGACLNTRSDPSRLSTQDRLPGRGQEAMAS